MKMKMQIASLISIALASSLIAYVSVLKRSSEKPVPALRLGVISGPESELTRAVAEVAERKYGLKIELIEFNDYAIPNAALQEGSIDANAFQHAPYLEEDRRNHNYQITEIGKTFIYPLAAYSRRYQDIHRIPIGARVAIPNDPSNEGRALLLLHNAGLIALKDEGNLFSTPKDIVKNHKQLKFFEVEAALLPRTLEDVDLAVITTTFASILGLKPTKDGLLIENHRSPYVNIIAVRTDSLETIWAKNLVQAFQDDDTLRHAEQIFAGNVLAGWHKEERT